MANRINLNGTSYHGAGAIAEIANEAKAHAFKKAFVCSDPDLIKFNVTSKVTDVLAKEAAFFSIGTNDLTGYTMAVDRGNAKVAYLYSTYNPAVLRAIKRIIECGKKEGIMVGMCGEAAADSKLIPLLLAFGLDEFSVSATSVLKTRKTISDCTMDECKALADKVMACVTEEEVLEILG